MDFNNNLGSRQTLLTYTKKLYRYCSFCRIQDFWSSWLKKCWEVVRKIWDLIRNLEKIIGWITNLRKIIGFNAKSSKHKDFIKNRGSGQKLLTYTKKCYKYCPFRRFQDPWSSRLRTSLISSQIIRLNKKYQENNRI